jgi:hypothetical protein
VTYTLVVIGEAVVLDTTKLPIASVVAEGTVVSVAADVPTFLAAYETFV